MKERREGSHTARNERASRTGGYSQRQFALYSMHMGPKLRTQSQLHFGVLSAGQVILQVSLMPIPHDTISQELELPATMGGSLISFMMTDVRVAGAYEVLRFLDVRFFG